jgi:peptidoglycan/LPS O-acetylase OafA/YrhL
MNSVAQRVRHPGLDVLRGIAIMMVLGRHAKVCPEETSQLLHSLSSTWQMGGWAGVDLFFVLSGFLVGNLIFRELKETGQFRVGRFLLRRGLKIYPAYYCCLLISILGGLVLKRPSLSFSQISAEAFFCQNYMPGIWNHTWSLAVEEHFYFLLAMLAFVFPARGHIRVAMIVTLCTAIVARFLTSQVPLGDSFFRHVAPTHLRIDALMAGAILAYSWAFDSLKASIESQPRAVLFFGVAGACCFVLPFILPLTSSRWLVTWGFSVLSLASVGVILFALVWLRSSALSSLGSIGRYSYGIYLWHIPVGGWLVPAARYLVPPIKFWPLEFLFYLGSSIVLGVIMTKLIELPFLIYRDRVIPSPVSRGM